MVRIGYFTVAICIVVHAQATDISITQKFDEMADCNDTSVNATGASLAPLIGANMSSNCEFWEQMANMSRFACCYSPMFDDSDFTATEMCCGCMFNFSWDVNVSLNQSLNFSMFPNFSLDVMDFVPDLPSFEGMCNMTTMGQDTTSVGPAESTPEATTTAETAMPDLATTEDPTPTPGTTTTEDPTDATPQPVTNAAVPRGEAVLLHLCILTLSFICVE